MVNNQINKSSILTDTKSYSGIAALEKSLSSIRKMVDLIKTSFGPQGLDKLCITPNGEIFISNDGATIISHMQVDDPICKILVNLAQEQDREVGDGTTTVVLLAYYLIEEAYSLANNYNIHPSIIANGYRLAFNEVVSFIKTNMTTSIQDFPNITKSIIKTSMASKIIATESELFSNIISEIVKDQNPLINIVKFVGGSLKDTSLFDGFILNCTIANHLMNKSLPQCKIILGDFNLRKLKLPLSVNVSPKPYEIEQIRNQEVLILRKQGQMIIDSGANLILLTGSIDDVCIKMFVDAGVVAVKWCDLDDLTTISKCLKCPIYNAMWGLHKDTSSSSMLVPTLLPNDSCGFEEREFGNNSLICLGIPMKTILIRGPNKQICDEVHRSLNDSIQVAKRTLKHKSVLPGGGAVEIASSLFLHKFAANLGNREYIGINGYADSLKKFVKLLCLNAGVDMGKFMSELLAKTNEGFDQNKFYGFDLTIPTIQDNVEAGIVEPSIYKLKALKAATEAAISIIRINYVVEFPTKK